MSWNFDEACKRLDVTDVPRARVLVNEALEAAADRIARVDKLSLHRAQAELCESIVRGMIPKPPTPPDSKDEYIKRLEEAAQRAARPYSSFCTRFASEYLDPPKECACEKCSLERVLASKPKDLA